MSENLMKIIERIKPESITHQKVTETIRCGTFSQNFKDASYYNTSISVIDKESGCEVNYTASGDSISESLSNCIKEYKK